MATFFERDKTAWPPNPRSKGYTAAVLALQPGDSVLLPTSGSSLVSLVGGLRRRGLVKEGEFTVRSEGPRAARIWRRESA